MGFCLRNEREELRRKLMKIAIVGAGISGASALKGILDHPNLKIEDEIHIFEPRDILGVGLPYSPDDESVMLNISPDFISVDEKNPLDFTQWLEEHFEEPTNFEDLVSRPRYGQYLQERFAPYFNHKQVTHFQTRIEDIEVLDSKTNQSIFEDKQGSYTYRLKKTEGWHNEIYDAVFLALGHPQYADYYGLDGSKNYIGNPYPMKDQLTGLSPEDRIGIIGSGATGIDLIRFFMTNYHLKHPLTFYVREHSFRFADIPYEKDDFQFTFSMAWIQEKRGKHSGVIPFSIILKTFKDDIQAEGVDVDTVYHKYKTRDLEIIRQAVESKDQDLALIHAYNSKLVAFIPHLYNSLSGQDKEFYLENYHDKLKFFKTRVPYKTFQWMFDLLDQGKIRIVHGISDVHVKDQGGFSMEADRREGVDVLVNATGFNLRLSEVGKSLPLVQNLYHKNIIQPQFDGSFVLIDWPQAQVMNQNFGVLDNLFFFGMLIGGTQHENNDAQLTYQLATSVATWFMDQQPNRN